MGLAAETVPASRADRDPFVGFCAIERATAATYTRAPSHDRPPMPQATSLPPWARLALVALALFAIVRGVALVRHDPLLALANNYDQIRYSACLTIAPWRPGVRTDRANPPAPYSRFAFLPPPRDSCTLSSDLLFTAPIAWTWRLAEAMGGRAIHSIRRLAEWRLLVWFAVAAWATRFFLRERRADIAIAHLAGFALVAMDPANTLYLATFYGEAAAVFGLYVMLVALVAAFVRPTRVALAMTAVGALILALSKYQHLMLPIVLGIAVWLGAGRDGRRVALVLLIAGTIGAGAQVVNGLQWTEMARDVAWINRADYALDVLLAETSDRDRVVQKLAINDECLAYIGKSVYVMPGRVDQTCKTVDAWRNRTLWWLLVSDPPALGRALLHIPRELLPWQPRYLGAVEGGNNERQPAWMPSLDLLFGKRIAFAWTLLLVPWLIAAACLRRGTPSAARAFALACATGMVAVCVVALFGDGDVEFAKHAHLAVNFALASLCLPLAAVFHRALAEPRA